MNSAEQFLGRLARANSQNPRSALPLLRFYRLTIAEAVANGASFKQVWASLIAEGKIRMRYETFRRHAPAVIASTRTRAGPDSAQPRNPPLTTDTFP